MNKQYEYIPENISKTSKDLANDLAHFYNMYEKFYNNEADRLGELEIAWQNLFFSVKHRLIEGVITENFGENLKAYVEDLMND